jgi:class 3 adenylate cyclase/tetratricopeptide (TPR) repeat protein
MRICPACGHQSSERAKFCEECATPLAAAPAGREQRKTVTVLFCDVTGSTALGESTDPEALRALLARYFERMKGIVEAHGGSVEKFIGDAVMAVFGVPQVHEDDALRAVRAACDMREALPELGVQARIGVNTGEVVAGTEERLATGDAVNVAARLEQAAAPGEILIGEVTLMLVRDAVQAEPVEALELKGKAEPVAAFRLIAVGAVASRSHDVAMVGRDRELLALRDAFARAGGDRSCQLFTVLGSAGVGKSRLAHEFLAGLDARIVHGQCLSYGEGITYWPVVEVLRQLATVPSDVAAAASLRSLLGETGEGTSAEEIAWAFRKLLEEQAEAGPLVCVFDDIHWAEATFLDLLEHVADLSRDAPILLLCMARPELLDGRPSWGGGKLNATTVLLEPLSLDETRQLLVELGGADEGLQEKVVRAAEGNPLFVEEMLALVREAGNGEVAIPPTIQALLAARLDQLDPSERGVLECGSVEGRVFHRGAVQALAPEEAQLPQRLVALVRKELVRPDKAQLHGDDAFRFRHLLIRDAAYDALPKRTRAELHERFAAWLELKGKELVELDEILGHHLEQAARYRAELGNPDPGLAERAGARLAAAGRRALERGDRPAAEPLLERALELTRPLRLDVHLELALADAQQDFPDQEPIAREAARRARQAGDRAGEAVALVAAAQARVSLGDDSAVDELERLARGALPLLEQAQDDTGLGRSWHALGNGVAALRGRNEEWAQAAELALRHYGAVDQHPPGLAGLPSALLYGPRPADEALQALDAVLPANPQPWPLLTRAVLLGMLDRLDEAWALARPAAGRADELRGGDPTASVRIAEVAELTGDHEVAAGHLRRACDLLEQHGARAHLSTFLPQLGRSLCALGRFDDAEPLAQVGRELGVRQDYSTQMLWRQVQARVLANRGEYVEAEQLGREAVEIGELTDALSSQGDALCDLAEVLAAAGRREEAAAALERALERYERKKNLALVAQVRPRLDELRGQTSRMASGVEPPP